MVSGFSTNWVMREESCGSVSITPKDCTSDIGWRTPATVALTPFSMWKSSIWEKSMR